MQRISAEKEQSFAQYFKNERKDETVWHFRLPEALPEGDMLALNMTLGTLSYLSSQDGQPVLLMQQQFSESEVNILLPLLKSFPNYCPYEVLYTSFYDTTVTEEKVERNRRKLQRSFADGTWDLEMRSVRTALSRTRLKTRLMGLDVVSILETGYILMVSPNRAKAAKAARAASIINWDRERASA
jgi:hypothetical protein